MLVLSEARYLLTMVNLTIFQVALAWIAALTFLHAVVILIITLAIQAYLTVLCF